MVRSSNSRFRRTMPHIEPHFLPLALNVRALKKGKSSHYDNFNQDNADQENVFFSLLYVQTCVVRLNVHLT